MIMAWRLQAESHLALGQTPGTPTENTSIRWDLRILIPPISPPEVWYVVGFERF